MAWAPELVFTGSGFKAEYFSDLAALEAQNFWFRSRNALIAWASKHYFPELKSFMEVGCGTGFVLSGLARAFPEAELTGTEVFTARLGFAAGRIKFGNFVQMDARKIPYLDEFDVIGAFDVLEHIPEDEEVLGQLYNALRPEGGLILTVPQHPRLWSVMDEYALHVRRYTAMEIQRKVEDAGFEILRSTSFMLFLLPAMLISRQRGKIRKDFDRLSELRISAVISRAFEAVLFLERLFIKMGLSLPIGGSRLIVARKK